MCSRPVGCRVPLGTPVSLGTPALQPTVQNRQRAGMVFDSRSTELQRSSADGCLGFHWSREAWAPQDLGWQEPVPRSCGGRLTAPVLSSSQESPAPRVPPPRRMPSWKRLTPGPPGATPIQRSSQTAPRLLDRTPLLNCARLETPTRWPWGLLLCLVGAGVQGLPDGPCVGQGGLRLPCPLD